MYAPEKTENNSKRKFKDSITLKLLIILLLCLVLLIPTVFITNLIQEREVRRNETIQEVTGKWGKEQTLFAPVLIVPYTKTYAIDKKTNNTRREYLHILPDKLNISGNMKTDIRYRGIYEVVVYNSELEINGSFSEESFNNLPDAPDEILWDQAILVSGISDLTGIKKIDSAIWNDTSVLLEAGIPFATDIHRGIHTPVLLDLKGDNSFHLKMCLNGSGQLSFIPAGKSTSVTITSNWPDPSFDGAVLPESRIVNENGFSTTWNVLDLTRAFPQKWSTENRINDFSSSAFGVSLIIPVDIYQKNMRSIKYALLFIGLTFLVVFFLEMISKTPIHIVQYLLIGVALIIFYSLLIAFSEHMSFDFAYLIASLSIVGLISGFIHSLFRKKLFTFICCLILGVLYAFLFVVLHMNDLALLIGNIGLFLILALIMFFSRKIDWYKHNTNNI